MPDDRHKPPGRLQSQTERDLQGAAARRDRQSRPVHGYPIARDQVDELADALEPDDGTPEREVDDVTKPHDIPEIGDFVLEAYNNDLAFRTLWDRVDSTKREMRRSKTSTDDKFLEALGKRPPNARFTALETRVKIIWAILAAVGAIAAGAAVTVAKGLYERGETDGQHEIRLQQLERNVERLEHVLERPSFGQLQPKGTTP